MLGSILDDIKQFGLTNVLYDLILLAINRFVCFKVLQCMRISVVDTTFLKTNKKYSHGFLDERVLRELATEAEYDLSEEFLDEALVKGDKCYAILDGEVLANYGWYSDKPTIIDPEELVLNFADRHVYMYKGFTNSEYRGQRLHAVGMTWALKTFLEKGYDGLVSYVEVNNFRSLKSVYRMGWKDSGKLYYFKIFNKHFIHSDNDCREYGFSLDISRLATSTSSRIIHR